MSKLSLNKYLFTNNTLRGIIKISNLQTDRTLLLISENLTKDIQKIRFDLDLGVFPDKTLQDEYEAVGLELYTIEPLLFAENSEDLSELLKLSKEKLLVKGISFY